MSTIIHITKEDLDDQTVVEFIHSHEESHYYWSSSWSPELYSKLAYEGLISITYEKEDGSFVLLPEMQKEYAVLDWENLHASGKVKKLLSRERGFQMSINQDFPRVIEQIQSFHKPCWLCPEYVDLLCQLHKSDNPHVCKVLSVELRDSSGTLVAGEVGYRIGSIYTSLSGFVLREKRYQNWGTLQLVLLGRFLKNQGFHFWNLGHAGMLYKERLGACTLNREDFLIRWKTVRNLELSLFPEGPVSL